MRNIMNNLIIALVLMLNLAEANPKDMKCLARVIYHEARGESIAGQKAVAIVTLNRTKHPEFPSSICKVVYQKGQYEWTTKKNHYKYDAKSLKLAKQVYRAYRKGQLSNITFFNKSGFKNKRLAYVKSIGSHKFYRIKGS